MLRLALTDAAEQHGRGREGFEAMGLAYVNFAVTHSSHYRVMFGRFVDSCSKDPEFVEEAAGTFQVLMDAVVQLQEAGVVRRDEPLIVASFIWAVVHGVAMLAIDGQLRGNDERGEALNRYAVERIRDAIKAG